MKENNEINAIEAEAKATVAVTEDTPVVETTDEQTPMRVELYTGDPEIQGLRDHCPVPKANIDWLRADMKIRGCTDSIKYYVLEDGRNMVLDGYNRLEICESENPKIPYNVQELKFDSRKVAINWFIDSQLKRRNLTAYQIAFLNGKRYEAKKQSHGGDRRSRVRDVHLKNAGKNSSKELVEEMNVTAKTLRDHAEFAKSIDKLSKVVNPEFTKKVLSEQTNLTMKNVKALANKTPAEIKAAAAAAMKIKEGKQAAAPKQPKPPLSKDEQFSKFETEQHAWLDTLAGIDKINTDTSEVDFDLVLETAEAILEEIERIEAGSISS